MQEPLILNYQNYRQFLKDLYEYKKQNIKSYSYRKFSKDLGFTASNYIHLIVSGKRNLSLDGINRITTNIKWPAQQKKYFNNLVLLNQAKDKDQINFYNKELQKIVGKKRTLLSPDQYAYFSTWYIPVLREIVSLTGFVSNLNWISKKLKPRVPEDLVKNGLEVLERLKMVKLIKNKWVQTEEHLTTDSEVTSDLIHNYHKQMLELSQQALNMPAQDRDISSMTMSLSQKQYKWLKKRSQEFRDELQQELQSLDDEHTMVAQINVQVFPVTEK